jgi:acetyl esterase/lipase
MLAKTAQKGSMEMRLLKPVLAVLTAVIVTTAWAEQGPMPEEIAWKLLELGHVVELPNTARLYAPLQQKEPFQGVKVERDVKYGPADRNLLDIFTPENASPSRPVLIFVRGGAFVSGDKHLPGSPFYDNIMLWAAKNGFVGVNVNYRLAPQAMWPAGAEDVAGVVQWVSGNIAARGGDPAKIYLMGHSAGAVHVASYVSHPEFHKAKDGGLAGAIMLSGIYDLTVGGRGDPERAYFGADAGRYAEQSSLQGLLATKIPLMITAAELDPDAFAQQFDLLKAACKKPVGCPRAFMLPQHSHMSEVYAINTADTRLSDEILDFIKAGK